MKTIRVTAQFSTNGMVAIPSVESDHVMYVEMPDGLRLRFRDGEYDGWYLP